MSRIPFITFTLLTIIFGCKKSESTSPTPQVPKYSIRAGDRWVFQRDSAGVKTDTIIVEAKSETTLTINNKSIKFYPLVAVGDTNPTSAYVNASDSILYVNRFIIDNAPVLVFFRLLRANVNAGDSWEDTSAFQPNTFIVIKTRVDSVNVTENVPAGNLNVVKLSQEAYWIINGSPTQPIPFYKWGINDSIIFVKAKFFPINQEFKLINYQRASQ
jgi:hypothetical protein